MKLKAILKSRIQVRGGGADVCYMARKNMLVLDGLGATGDFMHRADEFATIESIMTRSKALALLLGELES